MDPLATTDPERIDEYTLEGRLGAGGYGVVYAATDAEGRRVALKVLRPELADNPNLKERLSREGKALGRVGGDRNVEIYKVITEGTHAYLVMELVEGETLKERVERDGPLAGPILWFTAQGLIEALQAIHEAGITHRDLKPSNVMFGPDGVKVLDFGISAVADETGLTQTGAFLGTAAWISPEQILGREVTDKSDVFNLGLVVAFAATGRHAYGEGRPDAVMYRISNLDADLEGIDEPLNTAIRRCLQREPGLRPTVSELLTFFSSGGQDDLPPAPDLPEGATVIVQPSQIDKVVQAAQPSSGEPPSPPAGGGMAMAGDHPKRRKGRVFAALLVIAALAGVGAFAYLQSQDKNDVAIPVATTTTIPATTTQATTTTIPATTTQATTTTIPATTTQATTTTIPATTTQATTTTIPATTTQATTTTIPATTTQATTTTIPAAVIAERAVLTDSYTWGYSEKTKTLQQTLGMTSDGYYGTSTRIGHLAVLEQRGLPTSGAPAPPPTTTAAPTTTTVVTYTHPSTLGKPRVGTPTLNSTGSAYQVVIYWEPPDQSGSSSINNYEIRSGSQTWDALGDLTAVTLGGIEGSGTRSFEIRALNYDGRAGDWSAKTWVYSSAFPTTTTTTTPPTTTFQIVTTTLPPTGGSITSGQSIDAYLVPSGSGQWTFYGVAGSQVQIEMTSTEIDSYLTLKDPTGSEIATDDDSGSGINARISTGLCTTGTYTIAATSWRSLWYSAWVGGSYTISLTGGATDAGACQVPTTTTTTTLPVANRPDWIEVCQIGSSDEYMVGWDTSDGGGNYDVQWTSNNVAYWIADGLFLSPVQIRPAQPGDEIKVYSAGPGSGSYVSAVISLSEAAGLTDLLGEYSSEAFESFTQCWRSTEGS